MPGRFVLNQLAHEEYLEAHEWYEAKQVGLGVRFMECVESKLDQIKKHPEYFAKKKGSFREAKVEGFPYLIVYEFLPRKETLHIAAIYHGKRNPKRKYRRMK